jgi:hypothetical protein
MSGKLAANRRIMALQAKKKRKAPKKKGGGAPAAPKGPTTRERAAKQDRQNLDRSYEEVRFCL